MPKKLKKKGNPSVHDQLDGFDIKINELGQMQTSYNIDKINEFLNENLEDKKMQDRQEEE
jgi:hypothetical protein